MAAKSFLLGPKVSIDRMVPSTATSMKTILRCSCGVVAEVDTESIMINGWKCKCGFEIRARGNVFKSEGRRATREDEYEKDRKRRGHYARRNARRNFASMRSRGINRGVRAVHGVQLDSVLDDLVNH